MWSQKLFNVFSYKGYISRICIHLNVCIVTLIQIFVQEVIVKCQHPQLSILVHKKSNVQRQVVLDLLLGYLHFIEIIAQDIKLSKLWFIDFLGGFLIAAKVDILVGVFVCNSLSIGTISKEFHSVSNDGLVRILVSISLCFGYLLTKCFEAIIGPILYDLIDLFTSRSCARYHCSSGVANKIFFPV